MSSVPHQPHHHFNSTACEVITAPRSQGCSLARLGGYSVDRINVGRKVWGQKGSCITGGCSLERLAAASLEGMWPFLLFLYTQHKLYCESGASGMVHLRLSHIIIWKTKFKKKNPAAFIFHNPPLLSCLALKVTIYFLISSFFGLLSYQVFN